MLWKVAESYVDSKKEQSLITLDKFSNDEIKELLRADLSIQKLNELYFIKNNFDIAYKFFDKYFIDILKKNAILEKDIIGYSIKVFLYSGLEFIDTCEKLMGKLYPELIIKPIKNNGKAEDEPVTEGIWKFREFVKTIYDNNFSYRLCYNLRNCLQHVGTKGVLINKDKDGYHILLNKQQYMNGHSGIQPSFVKELKKNNKTEFDIIKLLYSYNENINSLFKMIEKYSEEKSIIDRFEAYYTIHTIFEREGYEINKNYYLSDLSESIDKNSINMNLKIIDIAKSKRIVNMHCKIFKMYGRQTMVPVANHFPQYIRGDNVAQMPTIIIGDSIVREEFTWKQTYSKIGFGNNNDYFSIYVPHFLPQKIQEVITNIIKEKNKLD